MQDHRTTSQEASPNGHQEAARIAAEIKEEVRAAYDRIDELEGALKEARLQLEYLHDKFQPTGTGEATLARINEALGAI